MEWMYCTCLSHICRHRQHAVYQVEKNAQQTKYNENTGDNMHTNTTTHNDGGNRRREDEETAKMQRGAKQKERQEKQKKESETTQTRQREPPTTRNTTTVTNTAIQQPPKVSHADTTNDVHTALSGIPRENGGKRNSVIAGHTTATV